MSATITLVLHLGTISYHRTKLGIQVECHDTAELRAQSLGQGRGLESVEFAMENKNCTEQGSYAQGEGQQIMAEKNGALRLRTEILKVMLG